MEFTEEIKEEILREIKSFRELLVGDGTLENTGLIGVVKDHDNYVRDGKKWRWTVIGLVATVAMNVVGGLILYGKMEEKIDWHDKYIKYFIDERMNGRQNVPYVYNSGSKGNH